MSFQVLHPGAKFRAIPYNRWVHDISSRVYTPNPESHHDFALVFSLIPNLEPQTREIQDPDKPSGDPPLKLPDFFLVHFMFEFF